MTDLLGPDDLVMTAVPVLHVPLLERLAPVRAAGFAGISVSIQDVMALRQSGMTAAEIGARITDAGLKAADIECVGHWLPGHGGATGSYAKALAGMTAECGVEIAAGLGARGLLVVEMLGLSASAEDAAAAFAGICDLAAPASIVVHLEPATFGAIRGFAEARRIVELAGRSNGAITLDPWHFFRGGATPEDLLGLPPSLIGSVQLCDGPLAGHGDPLHETTTARLLPGEGEFDLIGLVRALDAIGSTAPIGVEVFNRRQRTMTMADIAGEWIGAARAILDQARGQS